MNGYNKFIKVENKKLYMVSFMDQKNQLDKQNLIDSIINLQLINLVKLINYGIKNHDKTQFIQIILENLEIWRIIKKFGKFQLKKRQGNIFIEENLKNDIIIQDGGIQEEIQQKQPIITQQSSSQISNLFLGYQKNYVKKVLKQQFRLQTILERQKV
ncbi:unnamed protein product [Paramecium sonneborni]|uniref:Uncharacterized protein n=1 Tax=Paramecium sonneborni TaxID=65129 RepID=A0A8S1NVS4_9CILI|nr:unnamed protein product [Paramecium sonneborni]